MKTTTVLRNATAAAAAALALAAPAHADATSEVAYLQQVTSIGFVVYDVPAALRTGYAICDDLNYVNGEQAARDLYISTSWIDVPSMPVARAWVIAAANTLCPWTYHPPTPQFLA